MSAPFTCPRLAALALLNSGSKISRKAGSFTGQIVAEPGPLSEAQSSWLTTLLERAGLPPLADGGQS